MGTKIEAIEVHVDHLGFWGGMAGGWTNGLLRCLSDLSLYCSPSFNLQRLFQVA